MSQIKIVITATSGMMDFTSNTLFSMRASNVDTSDVLLLTPASQMDAFKGLQLAYGFGLKSIETIVDDASPTDFSASYAEYGTTSFSDLMAIRAPILRRIMEDHDYVVFADVDIVWLRNPMDYLSRVLSHYNIAMQTEAAGLFPPPFCMGFMAFRASSEAYSLLDWFQTAYETDRRSDPAATMQVTLNRLMKDEPHKSKNIFPLPETLFPNGKLYRLFSTYGGAKELALAPEPFLFHPNWTIGNEAKRSMLRQCGMWAIDANRDNEVIREEMTRLTQELKEEKIRNSSLSTEIDLKQEKILIYDSLLKERTGQAEQLLSHLDAAYAKIDELASRALP